MKIKLELELDTEVTKDEQMLYELVQLIEELKKKIEETQYE